MLIDPQQPGRSIGAGYGLLGAYVILSLALARIAWVDWWTDRRLAGPALVADALAFIAAVFVTESLSSDFTSPFLAFFTYMMLATSVREGWSKTLAAGLLICLLYIAVGAVLALSGLDLDLFRIGRRFLYMLILTFIIAWFSLQRRTQRVDRFIEPPLAETGGEVPLSAIMDYAKRETRARQGVIAWAEFDEPDAKVLRSGDQTGEAVLGPAEFDAERGFGSSVRLFDRRRGRMITAAADGSVDAVLTEIDEPLAELFGLDVALALPFTGPTGRGEILLSAVDGLSCDHVQLGVPISREISASLDRQAGSVLASERALSGLRDALARDLHDTVAQSLAGASLRVEGLKSWLAAGHDPEPEIDAMKRSLRNEQAHVRSLIDRLRTGQYGDGMVEAGAAVRSVIPALEAQWGISVSLANGAKPIAIGHPVAHEVSYILREAVANAVRHGGADEVILRMAATGTVLVLMIDDNGRGFPDADVPVQPWSIRERVVQLGGSLEVPRAATGGSLEIILPLERRA